MTMRSRAIAAHVTTQGTHSVREVTLTDVLDQHAQLTPEVIAASCGGSRWMMEPVRGNPLRMTATTSGGGSLTLTVVSREENRSVS